MNKNKRIRLLIIFWLIFHSFAYAQNIFSVKYGGMLDIMNDATKNLVEELSYEYKNKNKGVEFILGHYYTSLRGEDLKYDNDKQGRLKSFFLSLLYKIYVRKFYLGAGIGKQFLSFTEYYPNEKASVKNPYFAQFVMGYDFNKRFSLELKRMVSDLDIESGTLKTGISENNSRLNMTILYFKYKF